MAAERTTPAVKIRDFRPADYEAVIALWRSVKLPLKPEGRDSRENIERQVGQPTVIFLVAVTGAGRLVGTVLATHDGRKGWINRLAVDPAYRRQGLASRLVTEAERWFTEEIGLEVYAALIEGLNAASLALFDALGYRSLDVVYVSKRMRPGA